MAGIIQRVWTFLTRWQIATGGEDVTHVEARMQEKLIAISQQKITFISTYSQINGAFCAFWLASLGGE